MKLERASEKIDRVTLETVCLRRGYSTTLYNLRQADVALTSRPCNNSTQFQKREFSLPRDVGECDNSQNGDSTESDVERFWTAKTADEPRRDFIELWEAAVEISRFMNN